MKESFVLPKNIFYKGQDNHKITIDISDPNHIKFDLRNGIKKNISGVYVIFDKLRGVNYETPNPNDLSKEERRCIYVGEGKILNRLNVHGKTLIGKYAGEVVYYEIPDILDRKLFERLLIKHYIPVFNKENQYEFALKKEYMDNRDFMAKELIGIINEMRDEVGMEPMGEEVLASLFNNEDLSYNEIKGMFSDMIRGLNKEVKYTYQEILNRN